DIDDMSMRELREHIRILSEQGENPQEEWVEWHQRLSIPFASFIFVLLAAPLGIKPRRSSGSAVGMGLSILVIFIYYIILIIGSALGGSGTIPPWLGAWLQNIIFLILGTILLFRVAR
ncbi:MAG: LptF/LptG family permease, partial [Bacillota bacterium]